MWDLLFFGFSWLWWLAVYVWMALTLHIIANKTNTPNGWLAWIPIANLYLVCKVAGRSGYRMQQLTGKLVINFAKKGSK